MSEHEHYDDQTEEDYYDVEVVDPHEDTDAVAAEKLSEQLDTTVRKEIATQLAVAARTIAEGVVEELLTPEVTGTLREAAIREAEIALAPAPEPEPEPEPELFYPDVGAFVAGQIAQLFRREVSERGTEKGRRWCPRWWDHGEAMARLEALWRSWEQMRHGKGSEMAEWWIRYCDPMMASLLDPEGVFASCSVAKGHHSLPEMPRLPLTAAPENFFDDGYNAAASVVVSSLKLPPARAGRSRVVKVFPG